MIRACAALVGLLVALPVGAQLMEDVDYVRVDPPRQVAPGGRIEVVEFFYYGCSACFRFEPYLLQWLAQKPDDVDFVRTPAIRRMAWIPLTRLYYTLRDLGLLPTLHEEVYRAIHEQGRSLNTREDMIDWAAAHGIDPRGFEAALMSDATLIETQQAHDATVAYDIQNTPSLVVDGRFLTSGALTGDIARLVPVLNGLIDLARAKR